MADERGSPDCRAGERRFRAVFDAGPDLQALWRPVVDRGVVHDFVLAEANAAQAAFFGVAPGRVIGTRLRSWYGDEVATGVVAWMGAVTEPGTVAALDAVRMQPPGPDARVHVFDLRAVAVGDDVLVTSRDVTSRDREHRQLAEAEANYRLLAEFAADVVYRVNPDGVFTWVSPSVTSALGWDPDDLIGAPALDFTHPEDRPGPWRHAHAW